ncbi:MAG: peptidylprolyl isomerase, partial [Pseudomonadota bacterium]
MGDRMMMIGVMVNIRRVLMLLVVWAFAGTTVVAQENGQNRIVAIVNSDSITMLDLNKRVGLLRLVGGESASQKPVQQLRDEAMSQLIDEALKVQEARRMSIQVPERDVDTQISRIAAENEMTVEQFVTVLKDYGTSLETLKARFRADFGWYQVIRQQIVQDGGVSDDEMEERIELLQRLIRKPRKRVFEIYIPFTGRDAAKLADDMDNLVVALRAGTAEFSNIATNYSQASSSVRGGDLGWVIAEQLNSPLDQHLLNLDKGDISDPIRTLTGYYVLMVAGIRQPEPQAETMMDLYDFVLLDADFTQTNLDRNLALVELERVMDQIQSCGTARRYARDLEWVHSIRLESVEAVALPHVLVQQLEG